MATFKDQMDRIIQGKIVKTLDKLRAGTEPRDIGEFAADTIRKRTRLGRGVAKNLGPENSLRPLKDSTVQQRRRARAGRGSLPSLSSKTRPKKSNLTWTGKMLDSIGVLRALTGKIIIGFADQRSRELASYHDKLGAGKKRVKRPFFRVSQKDERKILKFIRTKVRSLLRRSR